MLPYPGPITRVRRGRSGHLMESEMIRPIIFSATSALERCRPLKSSRACSTRSSRMSGVLASESLTFSRSSADTDSIPCPSCPCAPSRSVVCRYSTARRTCSSEIIILRYLSDGDASDLTRQMCRFCARRPCSGRPTTTCASSVPDRNLARSSPDKNPYERGSPKAGTLRLRGKGLHLHATCKQL